MSHLLRRRRGHDSEDEDEEESIVSGMTTTDYDEDDSQQEDDETDSEYDSSEQDADAEQEQEDGPEQDEVEQQQPAVVETEAKVVQQATTTSPTTTSSQTTENKGQVNDQPKSPPPPSSSSPPVTATTTASSETVVMDYQDLQQQEKEKTVQELREYRRKLAEDPSFVPYVGLFWGHDDRYRQDSLATGGNEATRESMPPQFSQHTPSSASIKKASYDRNLDPLMHKKWDHSGYEELMRLEEQEERRKREVIESGESPCSQVDQHHQYKPPPRLPRHHHYNNHNQSGRGRGSGGNSHRGGYHHPQNRFGNSQKRPFTQQQQEWPQLTAGGSTRGQSISDNNSKAQEQPKVDAWGSVNRAQEIKPIVNVDVVADRWGASTITAADDNNGWGTSVSTTAATAANDGWGPAPTNDTPQAETQLVDTKQEAPKQDASNASSVQAEHGWGALPEAASTTAKPKQQQQQESEFPETAATDDWKTPPPVTMTAHTEPSSSTGWGEQPTATLNQGWNAVPESKDAPNWTQTVNVETTTELPAATMEPKTTDHSKVDTQQEEEKPTTRNTPAAAATDDGWGKPQETQDTTWSSGNETKDADTPQWESTTANNTPHQTNGKSKSTSSSQTAAKHNDIPLEEKASSSWANVQPDVQVHTTPSDFSKIDYSRRYDPSRRKHNSTWQHSQPHAEEEEDYNTKAVQDDSFTQQQQDQTTPSDTWGADAATTTTPPPHAAGWNTFENANVQNGWTTKNASTPSPPKSKETTQADASWDSKPVAKSTTLSWNAAPEATKPTTHWNESSFTATATGAFDQSNSSSSSSVRGGGSGWKNSRSSNSTNWNADREWNNKKRNEQQSKKSRGYFSGKNTTVDMHVAAETASNSTEGFGTPETSAWGHFQSTGDDDSDVEIILEAEEEPEWSKDDEQVLGMTAPADTEQQHQQDSPSSSSHRMTKPHLSQNQHDSGLSSPRPEYDRKPVAVNGGRHGNHNNKPSHARPYDENWRQPREEADAYRPMYYPAPVAHHPTYMPMIPNGNGNPMYAMSYPMGGPTSSSSSSSPSNMVARNGGGGGSGGRSASPLHEPSSSTSPRKFYTPSPPNVQQLPPGYEANGMVYYGMDPSAMYPPPQAFYYYAPPSLPQTQSPHMMANNHNAMPALHHLQQAGEDGWGPVPDTAEVEEQWRSTTVNKSSQHDFQNRKQQQPVDQYYSTPPNHHY